MSVSVCVREVWCPYCVRKALSNICWQLCQCTDTDPEINRSSLQNKTACTLYTRAILQATTFSDFSFFSFFLKSISEILNWEEEVFFMQPILVTSILPLYSPLHLWCSRLYSDFSWYSDLLERFRCFIQNPSFTHIYIYTNTFFLRLTDCYRYWIGSNWGFNILPKDTLAYRLEPPGIKSPTFQLVNNLLQDIPTAGMSYCPDLRRFRLKAMRL